MEVYPHSNFPESGDSSPHFRENDGEYNASWEETPQQAAARVKLMCSYGGRIQPRSHDNQLAYFGGETKILSVERSIRFPSIVVKLAALYGTAFPDPMRVKYQLPGEDLDSLISVTNDEDLEHMMIEYDRLRSGKPTARLRLFLFTAKRSIGIDATETEQDRTKAERMWFLETGPPQELAPAMDHSSLQPPPIPPPTLVPDFLSGNAPSQESLQDKDLIPENLGVDLSSVDGALSSKHDLEKGEKPQIAGETVVPPSTEVQRRIQGLQIAENHYHPLASMQPHGSDEVLARVYRGEYYASGVHDQAPPPPAPAATLSPTPTTTSQITAGYWADQRGFLGSRFASVAGGGQFPVYLIPASPGMYPSTGRQAYYSSGHLPPSMFSQFVPTDYRNFPSMYAMAPPPQQTATVVGPPYTEGIPPPAPRAPGIDAATASAYAAAPVAYDFYPTGETPYQTVTTVARVSEPVMTTQPSQIS